MVFKKFIDGVWMMVCTVCGAMCESCDDYDDHMHRSFCERFRFLELMEKLGLGKVFNQCTICPKLNMDTNDMHHGAFSRICPAWRKAFSGIMSGNVALTCDCSEECYKQYYANYEESILQFMEEMEMFKNEQMLYLMMWLNGQCHDGNTVEQMIDIVFTLPEELRKKVVQGSDDSNSHKVLQESCALIREHGKDAKEHL